MNRKEYFKNYRKQNREKYKEYQKKYYAKLKSEKRTPTYKINRAIEYIKEHTDKLKTIRVPELDFDYSELLKILGDKENE